MMLVCSPHRHHVVAHRRNRYRRSSPFALLEDNHFFGGSPFALPLRRRRPASLLDSFMREVLEREAELGLMHEALEGLRLAKRRRHSHNMAARLHDFHLQQQQQQKQQKQQCSKKQGSEEKCNEEKCSDEKCSKEKCSEEQQTIPITTDEKHPDEGCESEQDQTAPPTEERGLSLFDSAMRDFTGLFEANAPDAFERDGAGNATLNVPLDGSIKAEDVKLRVDEESRTLTVEGRSELKDEARGRVRSYHFTRRVALPDDLDLGNVAATLDAEAGRLRVALPRLALPAAASRAREIAIRSAAKPSAAHVEEAGANEELGPQQGEKKAKQPEDSSIHAAAATAAAAEAFAAVSKDGAKGEMKAKQPEDRSIHAAVAAAAAAEAFAAVSKDGAKEEKKAEQPEDSSIHAAVAAAAAAEAFAAVSKGGAKGQGDETTAEEKKGTTKEKKDEQQPGKDKGARVSRS